MGHLSPLGDAIIVLLLSRERGFSWSRDFEFQDLYSGFPLEYRTHDLRLFAREPRL